MPHTRVPGSREGGHFHRGSAPVASWFLQRLGRVFLVRAFASLSSSSFTPSYLTPASSFARLQPFLLVPGMVCTSFPARRGRTPGKYTVIAVRWCRLLS